MKYNPKDVKISWVQTTHQSDCDKHKSNFTNWIEVTKEDLSRFVSEFNLKACAHTIADCIGYHITDTDGKMLAKISLSMYDDPERYFIWSEEGIGKKYKCTCKPTEEDITVEGFAPDSFITISTGE